MVHLNHAHCIIIINIRDSQDWWFSTIHELTWRLRNLDRLMLPLVFTVQCLYFSSTWQQQDSRPCIPSPGYALPLHNMIILIWLGWNNDRGCAGRATLVRGVFWGGLEVSARPPRLVLSKAPPCQSSGWHLLGWESGYGFQGIGKGW